MKTIAFVTQKGGAGKTTLAASVAIAAEQAGEKVAILDLDPQKSLTAWSEIRDSETPAFDSLDATDARKLSEILPKLESHGFTLCILDTAGIDGVGTHEAMKNADVCLIPSRPTTMDIRATKATHEALIRLDKPYSFVLNQCQAQWNNSRAREASQALNMWGMLAEPNIVDRVTHQDAFAEGQGVTEYEPDSKAAQEIQRLWKFIDKKLKGSHNGKTAQKLAS